MRINENKPCLIHVLGSTFANNWGTSFSWVFCLDYIHISCFLFVMSYFLILSYLILSYLIFQSSNLVSRFDWISTRIQWRTVSMVWQTMCGMTRSFLCLEINTSWRKCEVQWLESKLQEEDNYSTSPLELLCQVIVLFNLIWCNALINKSFIFY